VRVLVLVVAALAVTGCGGERHAAPPCSLHRGADVAERTGEHTLVLVVTGCPVRSTPGVELLDEAGRRLAFAYVPVGGRAGAPQRVVLDKYRCDIPTTTVARRVSLLFPDGRHASMRFGPEPVMDWCPAEAAASIVRVYLGGVHGTGTYRDVLRDVYDEHIDASWSCGLLREAISHLPVDGPTYSRLPDILARAAARACDSALAGLAQGAPRSAVDEALGKADLSGRRCAIWRWRPASGTIDGARACFAHGRATVVQTALHG
jgi:hypothetical protein